MLLGGLLTRLQASARGSRLPSLPSVGSAPPQLLQSVGEFQQHDLMGMGPAGDFSTKYRRVTPAQGIPIITMDDLYWLQSGEIAIPAY